MEDSDAVNLKKEFRCLSGNLSFKTKIMGDLIGLLTNWGTTFSH